MSRLGPFSFRRFQQADLSDPTEYRDGRRIPFWESIEIKARHLDPYAISALRARKAFTKSAKGFLRG